MVAGDFEWECHFVESIDRTWCGFAGLPIPKDMAPQDRPRFHTPWMPTELATRDVLVAMISTHG
jgi:hypothetical protein